MDTSLGSLLSHLITALVSVGLGWLTSQYSKIKALALTVENDVLGELQAIKDKLEAKLK